MRIKIDNFVTEITDIHIIDEAPTFLICFTTDNDIFKINYFTEEAAQKALHKIFCFGYLEILEEECDLYVAYCNDDCENCDIEE